MRGVDSLENINPFHMALRLELEIPSLGLRKAVILQSMVFGLSHLWSWKPMVAASPLDSNGFLAAENRDGYNMAFHWLIDTVTHT